MGRVHKKKLAEYAEAAENEEQQKKNNTSEKVTEEVNNVKAVANKSSSDSDADNAEGKASKDSKDANDNASIADGDNPEEDKQLKTPDKDVISVDKNGEKKAAIKRKGEDVADSDDEPLNGTVSSPSKRGRKTVPAKPAGKAAKGVAGRGKGKGAKKVTGKVDEKSTAESEVEEEYEVKEIVDHKVQRGTTFYLIRWKGYNKEDDTWEPEDTLSCPDIIEKYKKKANIEKTSQKKGNSTPKKGRSSTGKTEKKEDPDKEWEVEKIVDYAVEKDGRVFRIRWKGFGPKNDTWEPEQNLYCDDLIEKFMKRMESQENMSFKELREEPKKTKRLVNETAPRTNFNNAIGRKSKRATSKKRVYYGDSDQ